MAYLERTSEAKKGRYRVNERSANSRFVDVHANGSKEATELAYDTDSELWHYIDFEDDWEFESVRELTDDDGFYPADYTEPEE
jgi:hypothetical protein